jgi:23S rRNA G2445 N2-methylase RlmL
VSTGDAIGEGESLPYELIATAASGTEAIVKRELAALGYTARTTTPGRLLFRGDATAICRTNLWLRVAERILVRVGSFPAADFDALFDGTMDLPWEQWLSRDAEFPVHGRSHR